MTEDEREELIEKMAKAWWECEDDDPLKWENITEWSKENVRRHCRTALAVAEPVIREECAKIAEQRVTTVGNGKDEYSLACRHFAAAIRETADE